MGDRQLVENALGVHVVSPLESEYTLCGDSMEVSLHEGPSHEWRETKRRIVTCPRCMTVILEVRGVRVAKEAANV